MFLDPFVLANALARKAGLSLPGPTISQLAWALSNGQGIARHGNQIIIVLADPLSRSPLKVVLTADATSLRARKARSLDQVVTTFYYNCGRAELGPKPTGDFWLPVLTGRNAKLEMGGRLPRPVHVAHQDYGVDWYQLRKVRIGSLFFFVDHTNTLCVYQRIGEMHFALAQVPQARNMVSMSRLLTSLQRENERFSGITKIGGGPTLLRKPPK